MSKEKRASTSVETFPGMMARISFPNSTRRRSRVASTFSSTVLPYRKYKCRFDTQNRSQRRKTYVLLAVLDSGVNQLGVFGLLGSREDQGRVGGGILRLVLANGCRRQLSFSLHRNCIIKRKGQTYWQSHQSRTRRPRISS